MRKGRAPVTVAPAPGGKRAGPTTGSQAGAAEPGGGGARRAKEGGARRGQRDEVVEQIVGVVGRDAPGERRARDAGSPAARDPELGFEVLVVQDERGVDIEP